MIGAVRSGLPRSHRVAPLIAIGALLVAVGVSGCAVPAPAAAPPPVTASPSPSPSPTPTQAAPLEPLPIGKPPASVAIPAIELSEPLIDLGILADGSMEVPSDFGDVGWFTGGGRPGGIGPTVIAGHVDSVTAPAIFVRLHELVPGDVVEVTDVAGTVFSYEVYRAEDYPKAAFPTADVFGAIPTDELRLITCTGLFDSSIGHYDDNRVVYAKPV